MTQCSEFFLEGILPLSDESSIGSSVLVQGFEMGFVNVPLHEIEIESSLVTGRVVVGVRPCLPVRDVTLFWGMTWREEKFLLALR